MGSDDALPILVEDLEFGYAAGETVLEGLSLRVDAGERLGVLGPSGAGKSTLLLHLNGVLRPRKGRVVVGPWEVSAANVHELRREVGIVFQDPDDQLFHLTIEEDIAFGPENLGLTSEEVHERVMTAAAAMRIESCLRKHPQQLSFGQRKRAAIATALAMQPRVLALDEPFANLDPLMCEQLLTVLRSLPVTIVMISQAIFPALAMCTRLAILAEKRIVAEGPPLALIRDRALIEKYGLNLYIYEHIWRQLLDNKE